MNCDEFTKCIDDYLDDTCVDTVRAECMQHVSGCDACSARVQRERALFESLAQLRVPDPSPGFFDRALERAVGGRVKSGFDGWRAAAGGALAAGLVAIALIGVFFAPAGDSPGIPELRLSLDAPDSVRLSFDSSVALTNAHLILTVPEGVDIVGAGGQRSIAWNTDIQQGVNILELPLIVHDAAGGVMTATVIHESREKKFSIRIAGI